MPETRPEVREPVRLELDQRGHDHVARERPVDVVGVELVDDVADPDRDAPLEARHQVHHAQLRERVAGLGDGGRLEVRVWQARCLDEREHQVGEPSTARAACSRHAIRGTDAPGRCRAAPGRQGGDAAGTSEHAERSDSSGLTATAGAAATMGALPTCARCGRERATQVGSEEVLADVARTLDDLAAISGVSRSTVSRVINGGPSSERTRLRVMAALEETGYRPNLAARTLASGRSGVVGRGHPPAHPACCSRTRTSGACCRASPTRSRNARWA